MHRVAHGVVGTGGGAAALNPLQQQCHSGTAVSDASVGQGGN